MVEDGENRSPYAALLSDGDMESLFSSAAQFEFYLRIEIALTRALAVHGLVDQKKAGDAIAKMAGFQPEFAAIASATVRDGLPVPAYLRQLKTFVGNDLNSVIHVGATSQDLIDTATVMALQSTNSEMEKRLQDATDFLEKLDRDHGAALLMGRTRMQAALPITVGDRIKSWVTPLRHHLAKLKMLRPELECLQLGGPVGDRAAYGIKGDAVAETMAEELGLTNPGHSWHSMRHCVVEYAGWLSLVTGSLGKMGQDLALMAQQGIDEVSFDGGGGSSAMPHKQNPVLAEVLVTFARFNATQLPGMHQALVHEQERSGAAWTLEWMILPQMVSATAMALGHAATLTGSIHRLGSPDSKSTESP